MVALLWRVRQDENQGRGSPDHRVRTQPGRAYIAYQVFGEGDVDLLWCNPWFSRVEVLWEAPEIAAFYREMARSHE